MHFNAIVQTMSFGMHNDIVMRTRRAPCEAIVGLASSLDGPLRVRPPTLPLPHHVASRSIAPSQNQTSYIVEWCDSSVRHSPPRAAAPPRPLDLG